MRSICLSAVALTLLAACSALGDGGYFVDEATWNKHREQAYINEPQQKAVVFFSKGRQELIISPGYEGPSSSFAWVVPVPSRPKVEIVKGAIFHELMKLTAPKPRVYKGGTRMGTELAPGAVTVIERKTVGAYDVSVLSATDGDALMKWLRANSYHLPDQAAEPIKGYVKQKWTFVACRVKVPGTAKGLQTGTLAPLRLTFATKTPVYPLRLSSVNPKRFEVLVYTIVPRAEVPDQTGNIGIQGQPGTSGVMQQYSYATLARGQKQYPTLAKLGAQEMRVYVTRARPEPAECTKDMRWYLHHRWY
jgi:hypothetical protein